MDSQIKVYENGKWIHPEFKEENELTIEAKENYVEEVKIKKESMFKSNKKTRFEE